MLYSLRRVILPADASDPGFAPQFVAWMTAALSNLQPSRKQGRHHVYGFECQSPRQ